MKKLLIVCSFVLTSALSFGQTSTISGQIQDPNGQTFNNGTCLIQFVPTPGRSGPYTQNGSAFGQTPTCTFDGAGNISATVTRNDFIQPSGSQWQFIVQPNASSQGTTVNIAITSGAVNIATTVNAQIPVITVFAGFGIPRAYSDSEVIVTPNPGQAYWNVTQNLLRFWTGSSWQSVLISGSNPNFISVIFAPNATGSAPSLTSPTIYSTSSGNAAYPFLESGNLGIQPRSSGALRDIVYFLGTPAIPVWKMDRGGVFFSGLAGTGYCFQPGSDLSISPDSCLWRTGANSFSLGNSTPGNAGGSLSIAALGSGVSIPSPSSTGTDSGSEILQNKILNGVSNGNTIMLLVPTQTNNGAAAIQGTGADLNLCSGNTILANAVGPSKGFRVTIYSNHSTGTASVTYKLKFGGTTFDTSSSTTTGIERRSWEIFNNAGVQNAQTFGRYAIFQPGTGPTVNQGSGTIDFTQAQAFSFTFNVVAGDFVTPGLCTLESII